METSEQEETITLSFICTVPDFDWGDVSLGLKWVKKQIDRKDAFTGPGTGYHDEVEARGALKVLEVVLKRYEQAIAAAEQQEAEET